MDAQTAHRLSALTTDFYARVHASFSATRQSAWPGWERMLETCRVRGADELTLLDLACGNLRLERMLCASVATLRAWAVDNCDGLAGTAAVPPNCELTYQSLDLSRPPLMLEAPRCDLAVTFGFMHHLPLFEQRVAVLEALAAHVRPQGHVVVSFWCFAREARILAKARPLADKGDYVLGWQGRSDAVRYCHSFDDEEIDELVEAAGLTSWQQERFSADGKRGDLNRYLVLSPR